MTKVYSFNSKDLWLDSGSNADRSTVLGFASIGGICSENRYSVIENKGAFENIIVSSYVLRLFH